MGKEGMEVGVTDLVLASWSSEGSSVARYTRFLSTCTRLASSWNCSSTCTMYSSMGWKAASVPTLSVLLTWTLPKDKQRREVLFCFSQLDRIGDRHRTSWAGQHQVDSEGYCILKQATSYSCAHKHYHLPAEWSLSKPLSPPSFGSSHRLEEKKTCFHLSKTQNNVFFPFSVPPVKKNDIQSGLRLWISVSLCLHIFFHKQTKKKKSLMGFYNCLHLEIYLKTKKV